MAYALPPFIRRSLAELPPKPSPVGRPTARKSTIRPEPAPSVHGPRSIPWHHLGLAAVLLLSAAINLYRLDRIGYGNSYYAAAVLSMLQSWHNFFFVSFDPGGFVSVDKPPLGFWIQVASAKLLGFSGLSILLPEALAGVASVAVLYHLVRRAFGPVAGLLAALGLALTPVSVAISRNNTIDSLLVLTVLLAVWAGLRASETGRLRWLLAAAAVVGLGFEIKMLQAYLVVPAIFLAYLVAAPKPRLVRVGHLALAGVALLVVSFAWPVAVDLTPAGQRPWVDSTRNNSAVSLAIGYNGLERLLGRGWAASQASDPGLAILGGSGFANGAQPGAGDAAAARFGGGPGGFGGGPGGIGEDGTPGPLRLLNQQLAGQAGWLLPLALAGLLMTAPLVWTRRRSLAASRRAQAFVVWGAWLATAAGFFSVAEYWHRYYLVMLAPPVAALAAIGVWGAWRAYRRGRRSGWLLPLALVGAGAVQAHILLDYPDYARWLTPLVLGGVLIAGLALLLLRSRAGLLRGRSALTSGAALATGLGTLALLAAPAVWSGVTTMGLGGGGLVAAGPAPQRGEFPGPGGAPGFGFGGPGRDDGGFGRQSSQPDLIPYLEARQGDARYLVATTSSNSAAPIILATGKPVMSLGGFLGSDPILTTDQLAAKIRAGEVRFFLLGGFGAQGGSNGLTAWIQSNCTAVSLTDGGGPSGQLYDCAALQGSPA